MGRRLLFLKRISSLSIISFTKFILYFFFIYIFVVLDVNEYREHVNQARQTLNNIIFNKNLTIRNITVDDQRFTFRNNEIMEKLAKLKAEIAMSKNLVDEVNILNWNCKIRLIFTFSFFIVFFLEIRVSLSGRNCSRRYTLKHLEPSTITKLIITLNYKRQPIPNGYDDDDHHHHRRTLIFIGNSTQYVHLITDDENVTLSMKLKDDLHQLKYGITDGEFYTIHFER